MPNPPVGGCYDLVDGADVKALFLDKKFDERAARKLGARNRTCFCSESLHLDDKNSTDEPCTTASIGF